MLLKSRISALTREGHRDGGSESKGFQNDEFVIKRHDDADRVSFHQCLKGKRKITSEMSTNGTNAKRKATSTASTVDHPTYKQS